MVLNQDYLQAKQEIYFIDYYDVAYFSAYCFSLVFVRTPKFRGFFFPLFSFYLDHFLH